jgi:hypothetical protein
MSPEAERLRRERMAELKATIEKLWVQFCDSPMSEDNDEGTKGVFIAGIVAGLMALRISNENLTDMLKDACASMLDDMVKEVEREERGNIQ